LSTRVRVVEIETDDREVLVGLLTGLLRPSAEGERAPVSETAPGEPLAIAAPATVEEAPAAPDDAGGEVAAGLASPVAPAPPPSSVAEGQGDAVRLKPAPRAKAAKRKPQNGPDPHSQQASLTPAKIKPKQGHCRSCGYHTASQAHADACLGGVRKAGRKAHTPALETTPAIARGRGALKTARELRHAAMQPAVAAEPAAHVHHFKFEPQNGPTAKGKCACGEEREASNSLDGVQERNGTHSYRNRYGYAPATRGGGAR